MAPIGPTGSETEALDGLGRQDTADGQLRGGRRGGRVDDVEDAIGAAEQEVVDEGAVAPERLGAHAGRAEDEVLRASAGTKRRRSARKARFDQSRHISRGPDAPVAPHEAQEARVRERVGEVAPDHVAAPVALAGQWPGRRSGRPAPAPSTRVVRCTPRNGKRGSGTG